MTRGKKIWGRKRTLVVDTLGLLVGIIVVAADVGDREAARRLLEPYTRQDFPRLDLMWADQGFSGDPFATWLKEHLGCAIDIPTQPWIERPGKWVWRRGKMTWQRDRHHSTGFQVIPKRWIVERSLAWITRTGGVCLAITRDFQPVLRHLSSSLRLGACSRSWLAQLPEA